MESIIAPTSIVFMVMTIIIWISIGPPESAKDLLEEFAELETDALKGKPKSLAKKFERYAYFLGAVRFPALWALRLSWFQTLKAAVALAICLLVGSVSIGLLVESSPLVVSGQLFVGVVDALSMNVLSTVGYELPYWPRLNNAHWIAYVFTLVTSFVFVAAVFGLLMHIWTVIVCAVFPEPMVRVAKGNHGSALRYVLAKVTSFR